MTTKVIIPLVGISNLKSNPVQKKKNSDRYPFQPVVLEEDQTQFETVAKDKSIAITYFLKRIVFSFVLFSTVWTMAQDNLPEKKKTVFFPNVCKNSVSVEYAGNSAIITVDNLNDIRPGDKIRIMDNEKKEPFDAIVSSVRGNYFTVEGMSQEKYGSSVYVYGKEVIDFRTVDYDALSAMNYSATKKLTKQVEEQKQEISQLHNEISAMKSSMDKLVTLIKEQNEEITKLKVALSASNEDVGTTIHKTTQDVSTTTRFIPNLNSEAISITYTGTSAVITVEKLEGLRPGDKIKLFNDNHESYETTVETVNGNCFTVEKINPGMVGMNLFVEVPGNTKEGM